MAKAPPAADRIRVVLAEDEDAIRRVFRKIFQIDGRLEVVMEARDGHEAVEGARLHRPDLVLLDVRMPGMDGFEALPLVRAASPDSVVVMLSMMEDPVAVERATSLGASAYIDKTTDTKQLIERLCELAAERPRAANDANPISAH